MASLKGQKLLTTVSALTCCTFLLIGYDNGVLGGVIDQPAFKRTFDDPDATMVGLIVSLYEVGCFVGALLTSVVGESLGRRRSLILGASVMLVGALVQSTAYTRSHMIVARIVSGIGMGLLNSTAPVYQSEFSPKASRGVYACAQLSTLNFGIFFSYWIGYAFAGQTSSYAWRVPVILQCIFIVPIAALALVLPESPRWLIAHDQHDRAGAVLAALHDKHSAREVESMAARIRGAVRLEMDVQGRGWRSLGVEDEIGSRRRLLIACGVQFFQQLGGINGIIYYGGTIFSDSLGFDKHSAALMSGFLFTWFFLASFIPWPLIDRIGRRPLLIGSVSLMAVIFAVMCGLVKQIEQNSDNSHEAGIGATAMLFLYMSCFTIGFQACVWVYPPEILSLRMRQRGTALATAANWIVNFTVVQVTPVGIANIGWRYYIIYAVFNACFVPVMYVYFPETRGLELEDVDRLFATGATKAAMEARDRDCGKTGAADAEHEENVE